MDLAAWLRQLGPISLFGAMLGFFGGLSIVSSAVGFLYERILWRRRIWDLPLKPGQLGVEARAGVVFVLLQATAMSLALGTGVLRLGSRGSAWLTALTVHLIFQVYYYWLHRAMHHRALLWMHRHHHWSQVTTPLSGQSVGVGEALGWAVGYVGAPLVVSSFTEVSAVGLFGYLAFNIYGNLVGHANFEVFPRALATRRWLAVFTPPFLFHALHHARWTGHYGFATAWTDRLFGTEWNDWPSLEERIQRGEPLKSLKERG